MNLEQYYLPWLRLMLLIRRFEKQAYKSYYYDGTIRGFLHVYIGQEAIAAALSTAIKLSDAIITGYRQHGIALARGIPAKACMAELFGRQTGVNKGKGGSMHFFDVTRRYFGGNGIVGAQIPIGTGIAFAEKYKGTDNLCVTMFGDGAVRQGAFHEAVNMAMTWGLPVIYLVENNGFAMGTSIERTSNITDLYKLGAAYNMPSEAVDGMCPISVHLALTKAVQHVRSGKGPYYLELKTFRFKGHSISDAQEKFYKKKEEVKFFKERDPIHVLEKKILQLGLLTADALAALKKEVIEEVNDAVHFADQSPFPLPEELYTDNYIQQDYPFLK